MVADKQFREDLFFRIKGVTLVLPPLRERREDIPLLIHFFLREFSEKYNKELEGVSPAAQQLLVSYSWPGNVRQLRTAIENMVVLSPGKILGAEGLPAEIRPPGLPSPGEATASTGNLVGISLEQAEKELIRNTLKMVEGNREQAAKILGIGERTLYRKIREYGL